MSLLRRMLRILGVAGKEIVEIVRRPSALGSTVAGPVLILAAFGLGYVGQPSLRAIVVVPPGAGLPTDTAAYQSVASDKASVIGVTTDPAAALARLRDGATDLVVQLQQGWRQQIAAGQQATIDVSFNSVSPYQQFIAHTAADQIVAGVNRALIAGVAQEAYRQSGQQLPRGLTPTVIAAPTRAAVSDAAPSEPSIIAFYGLMVLALIVQHTAITVSALSVLRERRRGTLDLFRLSPIGAGEMLVGKFTALVLLGAAMAFAILGFLVLGLGVPFLSAPGPVAVCILLLLLTSIGIGIVVALVSGSDRQAANISLLILLASVFFSGLALDLDQFSAPVRIAGQILPVTQAARLLQDLMLRGATMDAWRYGILAALAVALFGTGWLLLSRQLRRPA